MEGFLSDVVTSSRVGKTGILANEIFHCQHTRHPSCIIAEKDPTKGGEGTDQVCFDSDRRLDARRISRSSDHDSSGHDAIVKSKVSRLAVGSRRNLLEAGTPAILYLRGGPGLLQCNLNVPTTEPVLPVDTAWMPACCA